MKQILDSDIIHNIGLNLLKDFDELCNRLSIRYYLCGGTLLGAIRQKGFIPWDDDIDVMMPRPDYNKLMAFAISNKSELKFGMISHEIDKDWNRLFAKAYDRNTIVKERSINNLKTFSDYGIWIDIFPIDGLGNTNQEANETIDSVRFLYILYAISLLKKYKRNPNRPWYHEPFRIVAFFVTRFTSPLRLINRIESKYINKPFDSNAYCGIVCSGHSSIGKHDRYSEIFKKEIFNNRVFVEFEDAKLSVPIGYDVYLSSVFGDYKQLPPVEKRVALHDYDVYRK